MSLSNTGVAAVVAGLPSSGNRVIQSLLEYHGIQATVHHHGDFETWVRERQDEALTVAAVVPIRDVMVHQAGSFEKHLKAYGGLSYEAIRSEQYEKTMEAAARVRIPVLPVLYKHFVANPHGVARTIITWFGVPFRGLEQQIVDGDAKWLRKLGEREQLESDRAIAADKSKEIIVPISATLRGSSRAALRKLTN